MMVTWSTKRWSTGQMRKDHSMIGQTPTSLNVNDMRIRETLAKAERYHTLTRNDAVAYDKRAVQSVIRMPRVSLVRRIAQMLPRPA
jgi:hypothetical protein